MGRIPNIIIAVDGYSSTGKSTFAKLAAKEFGFLYLDSGALYRAVTLFASRNGMIGEDGTVDTERLDASLESLDIHFENNAEGSSTFLGKECIENDIRTSQISSQVSLIASLPSVRAYVDGKLHEFGRAKSVVMDGRDIGTTVFPDAELKIFMTASPLVRAERRLAELREKGETLSVEDVLESLEKRDLMDSTREISPLRKAEDAIILDNSDMTLEDELEWLKKVMENKFPEAR